MSINQFICPTTQHTGTINLR